MDLAYNGLDPSRQPYIQMKRGMYPYISQNLGYANRVPPEHSWRSKRTIAEYHYIMVEVRERNGIDYGYAVPRETVNNHQQICGDHECDGTRLFPAGSGDLVVRDSARNAKRDD